MFENYFLSIFLGTFILEDVALASAVALISDHKMTFEAALFACFLGISLGDMALYLVGYFADRLRLDKHFETIRKVQRGLAAMRKSGTMTYAIVGSRMIPGLRLPTYLGAGFLKYPFWKFSLLTLVSVFPWVLFALLAGKSLSSLFMSNLLFSLFAFFLLLQLTKSLVPKLLDAWERKALRHTWKKYLYFEFWPAFIFYLPVVPMYLYLSFKHRSALTPLYVNPNIMNGGLIGESKWEFLKHLQIADPHALEAFTVHANIDFHSFRKLLDEKSFTYPFILKPDVGQRGFGVRIIQDDFDLTEYLLLSDFTLIVQKLSVLPREAGLFYVRRPLDESGHIFSITDKVFPTVTGDGKQNLGSLILKDKRARMIAPTYFERVRDALDQVPESGEVVYLAECGNHCQGAIFLDGQRLFSDKLCQAVDRIAKLIPHFYFGRLDVRYKDESSLRNGHFEIVEINGAGSEATHIWDANTKLLNAYRTLFAQWSLLFEIGAFVKKNHDGSHIRLQALFKECRKVFFRRERLSVSS